MNILKNKVVNNASWIIACKIIQSLLALIIGLLVARYLGPSNYGLINYAASICTFLMPLVYLGLNSTLVQEIINHPNSEGKVLGTSVAFSMLSSLACIAGVFCFVSIANPGEEDTLIICVLYSCLMVFQSIDLIQYWFQAKLMSKYPSIAIIVAYLFVSIYKIFLLITKKGIIWFALSNSIDAIVIAVVLYIIYTKKGGEKFSFSFALGKELFNKSKYFILANLMMQVFMQTDKIMLKGMVGNEATGCYSAAVTCANITSFVFAAIIDSARPTILEKKKAGQNSYENSISVLYSIIIYLSIIQCIGMTILAHPLINIMYGNSYSSAAGVLQLVVWHTTFAYIGPIRCIWMLAENKHKYLWIVNLSGAIGNVILNFILIPVMGMYGAALASLVTQFFANVIMEQIIGPLNRINYLMIKGLNPSYLFRQLKKSMNRG